MLFASVTRRPVTLDGARLLTVPVKGHHVGLAAGGPMGRLTEDDAGPGALEAVATLPLTSARLERATGMLRIHRSPLGGRPLYHALTPDGDFFCSTHLSLLRRAGVPVAENTATVPEFFVFCFVTPPTTLFEAISQVPYGGTLSATPRDGGVTVSLDDTPFGVPSGVARPADGWDAPMLESLTRTIEGHLGPVRERVAMLLSGGMDSSILTAIASRAIGVRQTYSTSYPFEDPRKDVEKQYALSAAEALGVDHTHHSITVPEYLHGLLDTIAATEEPLHHLQTVLLGCLFQRGLDPEHTVVVCGQGADGLLGLPLHETVWQTRRAVEGQRYLAAAPVIAGLRALAAATGRGRYLVGRLEAYRGLPASIEDSVAWDLRRFGGEDWVRAHFGVTARQIVANRLAALSRWPGIDLLDQISLLDLVGDIAATQSLWSKVGERWGRAVVYPFTHPDLVAYLLGVPWSEKLRVPKALAQGVARRVGIPDFILSRPKSGMGILPNRWAERGGVFEPLVPLAARRVPEAAIREVQRPVEARARVYWNLLNYGIWRRLVVDGESLDDLHRELDASLALTPQGPESFISLPGS